MQSSRRSVAAAFSLCLPARWVGFGLLVAMLGGWLPAELGGSGGWAWSQQGGIVPCGGTDLPLQTGPDHRPGATADC